MADNILSTIAAYTRERVALAKQTISPEEMKRQALEIAAAREKTFPFEQALRSPGVSFICECKKASPSRGLIAGDFPYLQIAREYEAAGASCISVLTEPRWFLGSNDYLREIAQAVSIPCIRKDFTVDEYMIYEAKTLGASAVLLICSLLDTQTLKDYIRIADSLGLSALVEAHDEQEIESALQAGARIIGVNNRNLKDFSVDIRNSQRLRALVPEEILFVAESGIRTAEDISFLDRIHVNAVLIGETLMRSPDKKAMLDTLRGAPALPEESLSNGTGGSDRTSYADRAAEHGLSQRNSTRTARIKICGLRRAEDIAYVNEVHPEYAGFICFPKSFRYVDPGTLGRLRRQLAPGIAAVGVFVNEDPDTAARITKECELDLIQLHGQESSEEIRFLQERTGKKVIKAFRIETAEDVAAANASCADYILLDHGNGGTGEAFDWKLLQLVNRPYFLAGGLTPENVQAALASAGDHLYALDVSSGVETGKMKDREKIGRFVRIVRESMGGSHP